MIDDLLGKPYMDGGRGPLFYDCWGIAIEVYKRHGVIIPDFKICGSDKVSDIAGEINSQIKLESTWEQLDIPVVPCIVLIKMHPIFTQHIGVYIGDGKFMHIGMSITACIEKISSPIFKRRIKGFYGYVK